jgi:hypothetical protein
MKISTSTAYRFDNLSSLRLDRYYGNITATEKSGDEVILRLDNPEMLKTTVLEYVRGFRYYGDEELLTYLDLIVEAATTAHREIQEKVEIKNKIEA